MRILEDSTDWPYITNMMEDKEKSKENPIRAHISDAHIKYKSDIKLLKEKLRKSRKQVLNFKYRLVFIICVQ